MCFQCSDGAGFVITAFTLVDTKLQKFCLQIIDSYAHFINFGLEGINFPLKVSNVCISVFNVFIGTRVSKLAGVVAHEVLAGLWVSEFADLGKTAFGLAVFFDMLLFTAFAKLTKASLKVSAHQLLVTLYQSDIRELR